MNVIKKMSLFVILIMSMQNQMFTSDIWEGVSDLTDSSDSASDSASDSGSDSSSSSSTSSLVANNGNSPLHKAALRDDKNAAQALINAGAQIDALNNDGDDPLTVAVKNNSLSVVQLLLARGAGKGEYNNLLHFVGRDNYVRNDGSEIVKLLLAAGGDKNARDFEGNTPLHSMAAYGEEEQMMVLFNAGCDKNAQNKQGDTPLLTAVKDKDEILGSNNQVAKIIEVLLNAGADATIINKQGETALDIAMQNGDQDVINLLQQAILKQQNEIDNDIASLFASPDSGSNSNSPVTKKQKTA